MLVQLTAAALRGVEGFPVRVEVNVAPGLPAFSVVGLPQGEVREGRDRVQAALQNAGIKLPPRRITVNLAPADVRKEGSALDLPIALGLASAAGAVPPERLDGLAFLGELGLDGSLRPVRGVLPMAMVCRREGVGALVLPEENGAEAAAAEGLEVRGAPSLAAVLAWLRGEEGLPLAPRPRLEDEPPRGGPDLADVKGQEHVRRALEVAAAGGHNLLMMGPPGAGKTMLARRLPGILPPLDAEEALEATAVHSVAGTPIQGGLLRRRPFRAPHHTVSDAGLVGGGSPVRPGELSLAHRGVLFLDELPEFRRNVLESLRQPLEDGSVTLARARSTLRFPARVLLVAAMNPCPCGHLGDGTDRCTCDPGVIVRYRGRISGPLLERFDLHVQVGPVPVAALRDRRAVEASEAVRARVVTARRRQAARFRGSGVTCNAEMGHAHLRRHVGVRPPVARLLQQALDRLGLSARAYHRILKVARTLADLEGSDEVRVRHAAEAVQYRALDREVAALVG